MKKSVNILKFIVVLCILVSGRYSAGADVKARQKYGASPHSDSGECSLCHVASKEKLQSWFVFGSTKRQLKDDPNSLCQKCHGSNFGHATGLKTPINHNNFPLAEDGTITCATTCHDMHVRSDNHKQQFHHLRLPIITLCITCHDM